METTSEPLRAETLVIRAWVERSDGTLRARLTSPTDLDPEGSIRVVASVDELLLGVRAWAERLAEPELG